MPNLYDRQIGVHLSELLACFHFGIRRNTILTTTFNIEIITCHNNKLFVIRPTLLRIFGFFRTRCKILDYFFFFSMSFFHPSLIFSQSQVKNFFGSGVMQIIAKTAATIASVHMSDTPKQTKTISQPAHQRANVMAFFSNSLIKSLILFAYNSFSLLFIGFSAFSCSSLFILKLLVATK